MKDNKNTKVEPDNFPIFNEKVVVDRLTLPKYDSFSKIDLYTEIYLLKNYEYSDKLVIGTHSLSPWKEIIEQSDKKNDFFTIFRVNTKPIYMQEVTMGKPKTFYDKKIGVNFKFNILCNYSFKIIDPLMFLESVSNYSEVYTFEELYLQINNEIASNLLSFIAKSLLEKGISILEFNTYTKEFGNQFKDYASDFIFNESGIEIIDFNFVTLTFVKDEIFADINKTLYEKADMELRGYNYKEKSKYSILFRRKNKNKPKEKEIKHKPPVVKEIEGEQL